MHFNHKYTEMGILSNKQQIWMFLQIEIMNHLQKKNLLKKTLTSVNMPSAEHKPMTKHWTRVDLS